MSTVGAAEPAGSSRAEGPTGAKIGVTLCCAYSDLVAMQKLEALLREEGIVVEMLPGIDRDADALQLQLVADRGPTIYVLANSKGIEANRLEQLVQLFGAERGPGHRLLVLDVDDEDPGRMVLPVVRAHAAMRKHRSSGELPRRPTQRGLPGTARPTPSSTPREARDPTQREVQPLGVRVDAVATRSSTEYGRESRRTDREVIQLNKPRRRTSKEIQKAAEAAAVRRNTPDAARRRPRRKPSPTPIGPRRKATPREIGVVVEVGPAHDERTPIDSPTEPPRPARPRREPLDAKAGREARETARDLEAQRVAAMPKPIAAAPRKPMTLWLGIAGLAIVAAAAVIAFGPTEDGDVVEQRGLATSAVGKVEREPAAKAAPRTQAKTEQPEQEAARKPEAEKPAVKVLDPVDEAKRIAAAVEARRIHALDALLFVTPDDTSGPVDWATATDRCKAAAIDGIGSWRLPTVAEARKLRGARRLRPGRYWTDAAEGDLVSVVASSGGRPEAVPKRDVASALCVRKRIRG